MNLPGTPTELPPILPSVTGAEKTAASLAPDIEPDDAKEPRATPCRDNYSREQQHSASASSSVHAGGVVIVNNNGGSSTPQLAEWLDREVKQQLSLIDGKMDRLCEKVDSMTETVGEISNYTKGESARSRRISMESQATARNSKVAVDAMRLQAERSIKRRQSRRYNTNTSQLAERAAGLFAPPGGRISITSSSSARNFLDPELPAPRLSVVPAVPQVKTLSRQHTGDLNAIRYESGGQSDTGGFAPSRPSILSLRPWAKMGFDASPGQGSHSRVSEVRQSCISSHISSPQSIVVSPPDARCYSPQPPDKASAAEMSLDGLVSSEKRVSGATSIVPTEGQMDDCGATLVSSLSFASPAKSRSTTRRAEERAVVFKGMELLNRRSRRSKFAEALWAFLEDSESSVAARYFASFMTPFTILSVTGSLLIQMFAPQALQSIHAAVIEMAFDFVFLFEITARFVVSPNRNLFWRSPFNALDMMAVTPLVLRVWVGFVLPPEGAGHDLARYVLLCLVPTLRLFKTLRRFKKFTLLMCAFRNAFEALPVLLFTMAAICMVFSALILAVEPRDNVADLPRALWLTIVTMTTVGFGDMVPKSRAGIIVSTLLMVVSLLYMAMPIGIIGHSFTVAWKDRRYILLVERTRELLQQWSYTPHDIPVLFATFDLDQDGFLDFVEFRKMFLKMGIGFKETDLIDLFEYFDNDGSGGIDDSEFVRRVFPKSFEDVYGHTHEAREMQKRESMCFAGLLSKVMTDDEEEDEAAEDQDQESQAQEQQPQTGLQKSQSVASGLQRPQSSVSRKNMGHMGVSEDSS